MKQIEIRQIKRGNPERAGVSVYAEGVNFTVAANKKQEVSLLLYEKKGEGVQRIPFPNDCRIGHTASLFIEKLNGKHYEYAYQIDGRVVPDPYARCIRDGRCAIDDVLDMVPEEELAEIPFEDMILYKLHVRGFSQKAGKSIRKKGTFRGVEEAIPYFQELGINAVEFMPMYEWSEELRRHHSSIYPDPVPSEQTLKNYWGYAADNYYYAPKALFAAGKDPSRECRQMIARMHEAGIACIMEFYFPEGTDPMLATGALHHWKLYYGVDGFHLIGAGAPVEAAVRSPLLKDSYLFLDRVDADWIYGTEKPERRRIAEYSPDFMGCGRRMLKSDSGQIWDFMYQIRKNAESYGVVNYMANNNGFTLHDMVSYNKKHNEANRENNLDGMPANDVWNCGEEGPTDKPAILAFRLKQMKNAMLYTLLSQGIPLIYQGDEFANSQGGNNNAYAMDNEVGWVRWKRTACSKQYLSFVKDAIAFRKSHPVLHQAHPVRMSDYRECGYPDLSYHDKDAWYPQLDIDSRGIACMYSGLYAQKADGTADDFVYIAYNSYWKPQEYALPKLPEGMCWQVALQTELSELTGYETGARLPEQKRVTVTPRTVLVLVGK